MNTKDEAGKIKKEIKATVIPTTQNKSALDSIEEKIDQILKYQKHVRRLAIFRGIISFIFFFVFIILPIIGGLYLVKVFNEKIGVEKVRSQYQDYLQTFESITKNVDKIPFLPKK